MRTYLDDGTSQLSAKHLLEHFRIEGKTFIHLPKCLSTFIYWLNGKNFRKFTFLYRDFKSKMLKKVIYKNANNVRPGKDANDVREIHHSWVIGRVFVSKFGNSFRFRVQFWPRNSGTTGKQPFSGGFVNKWWWIRKYWNCCTQIKVKKNSKYHWTLSVAAYILSW